MLSKDMYTEQYIQQLQRTTGSDPSLLERVVYAFGLLEAIRKVGLPFCFKGGTALMLLLDHPRRISTDIDIVVEPGVDIDSYIRQAGEVFPFKNVEEQIRVGHNDIEKRHFRFLYTSPRSGHDVTILLDVLFETPQYAKTVERPIRNELLMTKGPDLQVMIPDVNSILGDKLTAFAPHTTGIPFGHNKELEIIKQLFDCGSLFDAMTNLNDVRDTYGRIVKSEMEYRGLSISPSEVLDDTARSCICIASRGLTNPDDYEYFKDGISRVRNHILGEKFNGEMAGSFASRVLYLTAALLTEQNELLRIDDPNAYKGISPEFSNPRMFSYLKVSDPISYGYLIEASRLIKKNE